MCVCVGVGWGVGVWVCGWMSVCLCVGVLRACVSSEKPM